MSMPTYEQAAARADRDTRTLGAEFLRHARRGPRAPAVVDARGQIGRLRLAAASLAVLPLVGLEESERRVGVLLPPGQGGALANLALALGGRAAVNLNHTTGAAALERMCLLAEVRTIITSRLYLERIGEPPLPGRVVYAEDLVAGLSKAAVLRQMVRVMLGRPGSIDSSASTDVACIIFSSGSTGEPRGVQLTHQQIMANCDGIMAHLDLRPGSEVLATPLPLFHCFGLIPGMWLCLVEGFLIAAQADPRDGTALGELCERTSASFMISTPTFVRGYMRRIRPEQLSAMRFAVVGAEKCPPELRVAFLERYGCELLEGYGTTELGPVVSVNVQGGARDGTVGRPMPGIEVLAMHPETRDVLPRGEEGLLVVRSPAAMLGYLGRPDLTRAARAHGGIDTGDVGWVDDDGFVHISGRLARFAKIGGEMVPLDHLETAMQQLADARYPDAACELAVAAVPDRRKGERVVVLHTCLPCPPDELVEALRNYPPLFHPRPADFHHVEAIPLLGSGKRDIGALQSLALDVAAASEHRSAGDVVRDLLHWHRSRPG